MILCVLLAVVGLGGVIAESPPEATSCSHSMTESTRVLESHDKIEKVMETGELNPSHYPAQRAAKVVQHYLNTQYASPYKIFGLHKVIRANAEDVPNSGRKYQLDLSVQEFVEKKIKGECSAEVLFPMEHSHAPPQVKVSSCENILKINTSVQEEAFFQEQLARPNLLFASNIPDSYGHVAPEHVPFWHLGAVVSSYVMLNESTQETLYNMAQVANVTQQECADSSLLKYEYDVLLHDMVSQDIFAWKVLFTWSPSEGIKVLKKEKSDYPLENVTTT
ncbi:latexin isoform X1 [Stigmatopora argus]